MRSTTKTALAAVAAIAATLAMGVSSASAMSWSYTGQAKLEGTLSVTLDGLGKSATCANVSIPVTLSHGPGGVANWNTGGATHYAGCVDDQNGHATQLPVYEWRAQGIQSGGGFAIYGSQYINSWASGPFFGISFANNSGPYYTFDLINGNATTPTKVVLNNDQIGKEPVTGRAVRATGELAMTPRFGPPFYNGPTLITLNP